jgi:hypothetical protein
MAERDARGRFVTGNTVASTGGRARAAALSKRRRRAIARKARRVMVAKHFGGDDRAQRRYFADLGVWNSEKVFTGTPVPVRASHPGPIQEWRSRYYQYGLFAGPHLDVEFDHAR